MVNKTLCTPAEEHRLADEKLIISFTWPKSVHVCKVCTQQLRYACVQYQAKMIYQ